MDCHFSNLSFRTLSGYLSLFLLMLLSVPLQGAVSITHSDPVPCGPLEGYYVVEFTMANLPALETDPDLYGEGVEPRYSIFWYFGDGTHIELVVPAFENPSDPESVVKCSHVYQIASEGEESFDLRVEITGVYLPVDPGGTSTESIAVIPGTTIIDTFFTALFTGNDTGFCNPTESTSEPSSHLPGRTFYPFEIDESEGRWAQRIRDAVPNDHFTLAIQYGFDICQAGQTLLEIEYEDNIFKPQWSNHFYPSPTGGKVSFNFEFGPEVDARDQMLYITFDVDETAAVQTDYKFTINRFYQLDNACDGKISGNDSTIVIEDIIKSGHDPNSKAVTPDFFKESGPIELFYLISFYNEGISPVKEIVVKDVLNDQLDPATVRNVKFWTGKDPNKKDIPELPTPGENEFKWQAKSPNLLPTAGLPPTNGKLPTPEQWAYLSFVVDSKDSLSEGSCIPNKGEIIFYYNGSEKTYTDEIQVCRTCCNRTISIGQRFNIGNQPEKLIRIISGPKSLIQDSAGFYISDENFVSAKIVYQECVENDSYGIDCGLPKIIFICNSTINNPCEITPPIVIEEPDPCIIWCILLLLLIYALLIYLAYRRTPTP